VGYDAELERLARAAVDLICGTARSECALRALDHASETNSLQPGLIQAHLPQLLQAVVQGGLLMPASGGLCYFPGEAASY
jgi:hypothetical protein